MTTKTATCSHCGTRMTLKLTACHGHELACGRCGAPLHEMKAPKQDKPQSVPRRPKHAGAARNPWGDGPPDLQCSKKKYKKHK